ncbi:MAG: FAD-binding oxidoreductase [Bradymonadia bacterium]
MSGARAPWSVVLEQLSAVVGPEGLATAEAERTAYARDLWPRSLLAVQGGDVAPTPPEVILWPRTTEQVAEIVKICGAHRVPLVPFGAGSGVCGGAMALRGGVVLDLKRMRAIRRLEEGVVEVEAGMIGQHLEDALNEAGCTLGHFPSSIWCSTVGGWLATRSGGQCSSRYGKIEDMCLSLQVVTGDGVVRETPMAGALGAGTMDFNRIFIGSEGTLGVITAATLKVCPLPQRRLYIAARMPTLDSGLKAMAAMMQRGVPPAVLRLYDPFDSLFAGHDGGGSSRKSGPLGQLREAILGASSTRDAVLKRLLKRPGPINALGKLARKCTLIAVCEGDTTEAGLAMETVKGALEAHGAELLGTKPAEAWFAHRHDTGFKQSELYTAGAFADTFEVATTWSNLVPLYQAVRSALSPFGMVMAHFSHAYRGGCSIYFTFVGHAGDPGQNMRRYDAAWAAALEATAAAGGAIAHHHGVGLARGPALQRVHGESRRWFDALKATLDPQGVLNPGKLFDADDVRWGRGGVS